MIESLKMAGQADEALPQHNCTAEIAMLKLLINGLHENIDNITNSHFLQLALYVSHWH